MHERREIKRADAAIPLTVKLSRTAISAPPIAVETTNISLQGLAIIITIKLKLEHERFLVQGGENSLKMIPYLLLDNKTLALGINILPQGRSIQAMGKVKWYSRGFRKGLYAVRAGVLIEEMGFEHRARWLEFLETIYHFLVCLEARKE